MKKVKQRTLQFLILSLLVIWLGVGVFAHFWSKTETGSHFIFRVDYNQMEKVASYLASQQYEETAINSPFGFSTVGPRKNVWIDNLEIRGTLLALYIKGYNRIGKNDGNTIYFERWYDGFERYRGFAFSADATGELAIDYVVDQQELSKENWYYYFEDYNEWRAIS